MALADANFRLGVWLRRNGRADEAVPFLAEASRLHPDSWNIWRQAADLDEVEKPPARNSGPACACLVTGLTTRRRIYPGSTPGPCAMTIQQTDALGAPSRRVSQRLAESRRIIPLRSFPSSGAAPKRCRGNP